MIVIKKKCETCGKFEVPEAQYHLVKADQADKVCQCAQQPASLVGLVVILPFMLLGLGVLAIAAPPQIFWLAGFIAGAFTFGLIVFLAIRLAIAPLAKN